MKVLPQRFRAVSLLCFLLAAAGCRSHAPTSSPKYDLTANGARKYHVRGIVVSTDAQHGEVTLDSDAIPGFMDAMIMPYRLRQPEILSELHPGDTITATLLAAKDSDLLDEIVVIAQRKSDYKPPVQFNPLVAGEQVPDFRLLNQSGRTIHLAQFRGRVLLVTFIYTRCPLADYCPRMSRNFAQLDKALAADPALYVKTHLLSVSFDPVYDTPKVLRSYGGAYTGNFSNETFSHWDFAAPEKKNLEAVLKFFNVGVTPEKDRTLTHSLSTIVIDPQGRVYQWYGANDWEPQQLLNDINKLLAEQKPNGAKHE